MRKKDITSCRGVLDFLEKEGELLAVDNEVDPVLEVSGITKALDNGPALLFRNVKGYPGHRILSHLFSRGERVAKLFGVADYRKLKFKGVEALKHPIPPRLVDSAPCQEVVITDNIDVLKTIPIIKHTETDPGRILGGGQIYINGKDIGHCISFKRTHFRGKDWASLAFNPGGHFEYWILEYRKDRKKLPLTINICPDPSVIAVAAGKLIPALLPAGSDELGIAGALQGAPVEIVKAKTVDACAIASSEWVIEGYVDTSQTVWESDEAEEKKDFSSPFFPEYHGHEGRARNTYKFQATAITHRRDNPMFYVALAHSFEYIHMQAVTNYAALYEMFNRQWPGLVVDVNSLQAMKGWNGLVIQVHKRRRRDEEHITNLFMAAWAASSALRMVIIVDDDVDIYNAEEVLWALNSRVDPKTDLIMVPPGTRSAGQSGEVTSPVSPVWRMGFDATVPWDYRWQYWRGEFPKVDLEKWFTPKEIARVRAMQSDYARLIADKRV